MSNEINGQATRHWSDNGKLKPQSPNYGSEKLKPQGPTYKVMPEKRFPNKPGAKPAPMPEKRFPSKPGARPVPMPEVIPGLN